MTAIRTYNGVIRTVNGVMQSEGFFGDRYTITDAAFLQGTYFFTQGFNGEHIASQNKTFFVFQGADEDAYACEYDHATKQFTNPVKVGDTAIPSGSADGHGFPCMAIDSSGYIHVFFGCHYHPMQYARSTNPYDTTAWTNMPSIDTTATYPNAMIAPNDDIYLFYRQTFTGSGFSFIKSTDGGDTWSSFTSLADFGSYSTGYGHAEPDFSNNRIYYAFTEFITNTNSLRNDGYVVYYDLNDGHVKSLGGTDFGTSVTRTEARADNTCHILSNFNTQIPSVVIHDGNPHVIWTYEDVDGWTYHYYIYWNGSAWSTPQKITEGAYANGYRHSHLTDLIVNNPNNIEALLTCNRSGDNTYNGDIELWAFDGTKWDYQFTYDTMADHAPLTLNHPRRVKNGTDIKMLWTEITYLGGGSFLGDGFCNLYGGA